MNNNTGDYFVMLNTQGGGYTPLETYPNDAGDAEIAKFTTLATANKGAEDSVLGGYFGYEVFQIGMGE